MSILIEKKGIRIYYADNVDYELLERGKYLKITWYKRDEFSRRTIVSREVLKKINKNKILNENFAVWKRCQGYSEKKGFAGFPCYMVYRYAKYYYKVTYNDSQCLKVTYYKKG